MNGKIAKLRRRALENDVLLTRETIESFYDGSRSGTTEQCLLAVCESHERLRLELQNLRRSLAAADAEINTLKARIAELEKDVP
jgi:hypothetical protein